MCFAAQSFGERDQQILTSTWMPIVHSEEFFRLKKIQGKKKRDTEAAQAEIAAEKEEDVEYSADSGIGGGDAGGKDMLDQGKDEDVIF